MFLDKTFTERLLEQLEDAQALLAQMLTSRYGDSIMITLVVNQQSY